MTHIFLWKPNNSFMGDTSKHFSETITNYVDELRAAFGRDFSFRILEVNNLWIGQVNFETQVTDWTPWIEHGDKGVAWSGICENFLGKNLSAAEVEDIINMTNNRPENLIEWDGRFGICTWDRGNARVMVSAGATETTSFWHTEGPTGWALGNQALPLLNLTGKTPEIDLEVGSLYAAFGYHFGNNNLFKGVNRMTSRQQVVLCKGQDPEFKTYLTLDKYLRKGSKAMEWEEAVSACAHRIVSRIDRQLKHSSNPHVLLTGGRDSRCIAAAAVKSGYKGVALTSGASDSEDSQIAAKVAKALGIKPKHIVTKNSFKSMLDAPNRLDLWMKLNEGMDMILHASSFQDFFQKNLPIPQTMLQKFHGLWGVIGRDFYNTRNLDVHKIVTASEVSEYFIDKIPPHLMLSSTVKEHVRQKMNHIEKDLNGMSLTFGEWLDLVYWQVRCLQWGEDQMSVQSMMGWLWTPLVDRVIIQTTWNLLPHQKMSPKFIEAVTLKLQPSLSDIQYDTKHSAKSKSYLKILKGYFKKIIYILPFIYKKVSKNPAKQSHYERDLQEFWETLFFEGHSHIWPQIIEKQKLQEALKNPKSKLMWNLGTVELLKRATTSSQVKRPFNQQETNDCKADLESFRELVQ